MSMGKILQEGWAKPPNSPTWHYFRNDPSEDRSLSLCGFLYFRPMVTDYDETLPEAILKDRSACCLSCRIHGLMDVQPGSINGIVPK